MSRTDKQREADDNLTEALERWLRAYEFDGSANGDGVARVLTDYVVFMATQGWADDGDSITGHPYCLRDASMPLYRAVGLATIGVELLASTMHEDDEGAQS